MDSSLIDSGDEQTFHLIRLPKETVERCKDGDSSKVGSIFVYENGDIEFQDDKSLKVYTIMRNTPKMASSNQKRVNNHLVANEESDLFKISLQKNEALHLGKVKLSTFLAVPKDGAIDAATAFG